MNPRPVPLIPEFLCRNQQEKEVKAHAGKQQMVYKSDMKVADIGFVLLGHESSPLRASGVSYLSEAYNLKGIQGPRRLRHETSKPGRFPVAKHRFWGNGLAFISLVYWVQMNAVLCGSQATKKPPRKDSEALMLT